MTKHITRTIAIALLGTALGLGACDDKSDKGAKDSKVAKKDGKTCEKCNPKKDDKKKEEKK